MFKLDGVNKGANNKKNILKLCLKNFHASLFFAALVGGMGLT